MTNRSSIERRLAKYPYIDPTRWFRAALDSAVSIFTEAILSARNGFPSGQLDYLLSACPSREVATRFLYLLYTYITRRTITLSSFPCSEWLSEGKRIKWFSQCQCAVQYKVKIINTFETGNSIMFLLFFSRILLISYAIFIFLLVYR